MVKDIRKLLHVLDSELKIQDQLLELLMRERAAVARLQQDQLSSLAIDKEQLLDKVRTAEARIKSVISEVFPNSEGKKLSELIKTLPASTQRTEVSALNSRLRASAEQVREFHNYNAHLIRNAMGIVSGTIGVIYNAATPTPPTYGGNGSLRDDKTPRPPQRTVLSREA